MTIFLFIVAFICLYCILLSNKRKYSLLIASISCNRILYLNNSLLNIYNHIKKYEKKIESTLVNIDQGTPDIDLILHERNKNVFYLNPSRYVYSFKLLFSILYTNYLLILEEDWVLLDNIQNKLKITNFLYISMKVLQNSKMIYGLYLRYHPKGNSTLRFDKHLNVKYYEVTEPYKGFCYTNGASIYKAKYLKIMTYMGSEFQTARRCMKLKFHIGYILWEFKNSSQGLFYIFKHTGKRSTRMGICNLSLY